MSGRRGWICLATSGTLAIATGMLGTAAVAVADGSGGNVPPEFVGTLAGPGLADMYPVDVDHSDTRYFVLDSGRYRVVAVDRINGNIVSQVGGHQGKGDAEFAGPRAIARDTAGNIFVADTSNNRVQKFDPNLNFLLKWGTKGVGNGQFTLDYGIAVGPGSGNGGSPAEVVYVTDTSDGGRVQKFTRDGIYLAEFGSSELSQPRQIAVDPSTKNVWVINATDNNVVVFNQNGEQQFRFGGVGAGDGRFKGDPRGIAILGSFVYVSDEGNHRIQVFDTSGNFVAKFGSKGTGDGQFVDPRGLTITSDGTLLITDEWDYALKEFDAEPPSPFTFIRKLFGGGPLVGGVNSPRGIDVNTNTGQIYVMDWWNNRIQRFDADGSNPISFGFRGVRSEPGSLSFAWDLAIQQTTGRVFVANRELNEIEVFDGNGNYVTRWGNVGAEPGLFKFPQGVGFSPLDGTLLVADTDNHRIQRFSIAGDGSGIFIEQFGSKGPNAGQFNKPTGLSVEADGTIWVADTLNNRVQKRDPITGVWTAIGVPVGGTKLKAPWGVTVAPDGSVWVADSANNRIVKMDASGTQEFAMSGDDLGAGVLDAPFEIAFEVSGRVLISDTWNNRVIELE